MSEEKVAPSVKLAVRTKTAVELFTCDWSNRAEPLSAATTHIDVDADDIPFYWSPDGRHLAIILQSSVLILDGETDAQKWQLGHESVVRAAFSPKGSVLVTWSRAKQTDSLQNGNIKIWDMTTGAQVSQLYSPRMWMEQCPLLWVDDESLCAKYPYGNQVDFFHGAYPASSDAKPAATFTVSKEARAPKLTSFSLCPASIPGSPHRFSVFCQGAKGAPASFSLYAFPDFDTPTNTQSFFGHKVVTHWSPDGTKVLLEAQADLDDKNEKHEGKSQLFLMHSDSDFRQSVVLGQEGSLQGVGFSPNNRLFIAVHGSPASSILYNSKDGRAMCDFNTGPRNFIEFSPHGRFVCLAGFLNLPGDMDFFDVNKKKLLGKCQDHGSRNPHWSADGRAFVTARMHPHRRVDNGFIIWSYNGNLILNRPYEKLYQVQFRPAPASAYPDQGGNPRTNVPPAEVLTAKNFSKSGEQKKKAGAYVPPGARGRTGPPTNTTLDYKKKVSFAPKNLAANSGAPKKDAAQLRAEKNRARKDRIAAKKERQRLEQEAAAQQAAMAKKAAEAERQAAAEKPPETQQEAAKRIKKLNKRLRQIDQLKQKDRATLGDDALAKIDEEPSLRDRIRALEAMQF